MISSQLIPLSLMPCGQLAVVSNVIGQPDHVHRLHELGLRDGAQVEMVQSGSPCIIRLAGNKLCFRGDEAMTVLVRAESQ